MKVASTLTPFFVLVSAVATAIGKGSPEENNLVSVMQITEVRQISDACIYDYTLKDSFKNLPLPEWLNSWEDLMSDSLCVSKYDVKVDPNASPKSIASMLAFSLASGYDVREWKPAVLHKRFEKTNLEEMMDVLWKTGDISQSSRQVSPEEIEKQAGSLGVEKREIFKVGNVNWLYDENNKARVSVLEQLRDSLRDQGGNELRLKRSAICHEDRGWRGCFSWSGGEKRVKAHVGADILSSAIGGYNSDDWVSAKAAGAVWGREWNRHHDVERPHNACVSNRPNRCT
ncbi:hypothetical protein OXX79_005187 [Metschnikowia pulcherrima]